MWIVDSSLTIPDDEQALLHTIVELGAAPEHLSPDHEAICFRLKQESLTNVAKHARANQVTVRMGQADGGLLTSVRDDGACFDPGTVAERPGHVGLRQMQERVQTVDGRVTILSQPGAGTEIRGWLPLCDTHERISA